MVGRLAKKQKDCPFSLNCESDKNEVRTHDPNGGGMAKLECDRPKCYNHWVNLSLQCVKGNYDIFEIINETIILHQKFQISNF